MSRGSIVTINFGPFAGLSGVVLSSADERIVVRLVLNGRTVPVELDADMIHMPVRERMHRPADLRQRTRPA